MPLGSQALIVPFYWVILQVRSSWHGFCYTYGQEHKENEMSVLTDLQQEQQQWRSGHNAVAHRYHAIIAYFEFVAVIALTVFVLMNPSVIHEAVQSIFSLLTSQ